MIDFIVKWEDGAYSVYQDDEFIHDTQDLSEALSFALGCSANCPEYSRVIVERIEEK